MVGSQTALKAIWASLLKQPPDVAHIIKGADGMALLRSLSLDESLLQLPDRRQLSSVPVLQSVDLDKKVAMLAGWEVFA